MDYLEHYSRFNDLTIEGRRRNWRSYDLHFAPLLPPSREVRVLDIGCGAGLLLEWLTCGAGYLNATGIDVDDSQVKFARGIGQNAQVVKDIVGWLETQPAFDVVFMTDVLEHLTDAEAATYLRAIHAQSNPEMRLIVRVPNALSPVAPWSLFQDITHQRLYTVESLFATLQRSGFHDVRIVASESWNPNSVKEALVLAARACLRLPLRLRYRLELGRAASAWPLSPNLIAFARKDGSAARPTG